MITFKGRHTPKPIILQCVRWYCSYALSYRNIEEMMAERGLRIDHSTLNRWRMDATVPLTVPVAASCIVDYDKSG